MNIEGNICPLCYFKIFIKYLFLNMEDRCTLKFQKSHKLTKSLGNKFWHVRQIRQMNDKWTTNTELDRFHVIKLLLWLLKSKQEQAKYKFRQPIFLEHPHLRVVNNWYGWILGSIKSGYGLSKLSSRFQQSKSQIKCYFDVHYYHYHWTY